MLMHVVHVGDMRMRVLQPVMLVKMSVRVSGRI
jgi:hypothetical protein